MNDTAHRAALDHVLRLVAEADCGDSLILRGSMAMLAWVGNGARPPRDLDWIVRPSNAMPVDDRHPYPYLEQLDSVQLWPEVAHGAGRPKIWMFEDLDTGGFYPRLPPEGLHWLTAAELDGDVSRPHDDVIAAVRAQPLAAGGVVLDVDNATFDSRWTYAYSDGDEGDAPREVNADEGGGIRVVIPWRVEDGPTGSVQVDFSYDEVLPEPPVLAAVPCEDTPEPTVVWAATAAASLVWKLQWLGTDQVRRGSSEGKDLYDAVLLAELSSTEISPRLRHALRSRVPDADVLRPEAVRQWTIDWSSLNVHSGTQGWLDRLATALAVLLDS